MTRTIRWVVFGLAAVASSAAARPPALEPHELGALTVQTPKGTVTFDGNVMTFHAGAMAGWHGYTGSISSGPFVRIRLKDPTAIASSLLLGDGMCYLQRK